MTLLSSDVAIVTGAARGIGFAIAEALAREGARVLLTDIAEATGEIAARSLIDEGLQARFLSADLSDANVPEQLVHHALTIFGPTSILVHAASPAHNSETILEVPEDAWDHMLEVNVRAGYRLARLLGKQMLSQNIKGRMVFIS